MNGKLFYQTYTLDTKNPDVFSHWIPDGSEARNIEYPYNETLATSENAAILSESIVRLLGENSTLLKLEATPKAVSIWGEDFFGAEVFYQDQSGTKKISARVR